MADQNAKSYLIEMEFGTWWFLESLITNPSSIFRNLKFGIQFGEQKCKTLLDCDKIWYSGVTNRWLRISAQHLEILNVRSNMADQNTKSYLIGIKFTSWEFLG